MYCNVVAIIYKNNNFESYSKQIKLDNATDNTNEIYKVVLHLLDISYRNEPIRLIGVRLADFTNEKKKQISLFDNEEVNENGGEIQKILDDINNKFGMNSIVPASMKKNIDK